jgi:hypothetical protein
MGDLDNQKITLDLVLDIKDEKTTTKLLTLNVISLVVVAIINILTIWLLITGR